MLGMRVKPPILSEAWADRIRRSGKVDIGEFTQAQLLAAGIRHANPSRSSPTTFDRLDEGERAAHIDRALSEDPGDSEALGLIHGVTKSPRFSGSWSMRPPAVHPDDIGDHLYLEGMDLADGSPGVLVGLVDRASSRWRYTIHELASVPRRLAESTFAIKDPHAPEEKIEIASAVLGLVWPSGRWESRPREITWILACPTSGTKAHLQTQRNFGKRSERDWKGLVTEQELAGRMLELFEQCACEGRR